MEFTSILDRSVFGFAFWGKEPDFRSESYYCFDKTKRVVLVDVKENKGAEQAISFFAERGYLSVSSEVFSSSFELDEYMKKVDDRDEVGIVFLSSKAFKTFEEYMKESGLPFQLFSMVKVWFNVMRPKLLEVYDLLEDDRSKDAFLRIISVRYKIEPPEILKSICERHQYFAERAMRLIDPEEVYVDCGAFVGENIECYLFEHQGLFKQIFAFEPGERQCRALECRKERLVREWALNDDTIVVNNAGVGRERMTANLVVGDGADLLSLKVEEGEGNTEAVSECEIYDLDSYFKDIHVGFLKADIEGYEMEMLRGATNLIKRDKPKIAICIYHKLTDYYEIPLFIHELVPEYKFSVHHHSEIFEESVLYCWV